MAHGSAPIDPGNTLSLPVAVDLIAGVNYQRTKLADATEGATTATGINANPLKVQQRTRGTADYDSGISAVPASATVLQAGTVWVDKLLITNASDVVRTFTLTNGVDAEVFSVFPIAPRNTVVYDLGGMEFAGIKWSASAVSTVRAQIRGWQ